jgi:DNA-binding transcriptional MerR regulator
MIACAALKPEKRTLQEAGLAHGPTLAGREYTINELAGEFGLTLRALRFYEERGFLKPRRIKRERRYSEEQRRRVAWIMTGRKLGFTVREIGALIRAAENEGRGSLTLAPEQIEAQIRHLEEKLQEINHSLAELRARRGPAGA